MKKVNLSLAEVSYETLSTLEYELGQSIAEKNLQIKNLEGNNKAPFFLLKNVTRTRDEMMIILKSVQREMKEILNIRQGNRD